MTYTPLSDPRRKHLLLAFVSFVVIWLLWHSPSASVIDPSYGLLEDVSQSSRFRIATFLSENPGTDPQNPEGTDYYYAELRCCGAKCAK